MNSQDKRNHRLWFPFFIILTALTYSTALRAATILVATGPGPGHLPIVRVVVNGGAGNDTISFMAYPSKFTGGVRVAVGDVNGDGVADIITAPGPGFTPHVKVFDGKLLGQRGSLLMSFNAFPGFFRGGVYVAAGDVTGDGRADIIVAPDAGAPPIVRLFDGNTGNLLKSFFAYAPTFTGGVRVAAGDVNGDGQADIITGAGPGAAGGHVKVFDGKVGQELKSFLAFPGFSGGVFVAAGDINNDGHDDLVVGAGGGAGGHVKVFDAVSDQLALSFFAFDPSFTGGVRVGAGDVNGDNIADIIAGAGPGAGPHVKVFRGTDLLVLHSFFAYEANFQGGVFVGGGASRRVGR